MDAVLDRLMAHRYTKAVFFVDNAGSDVVLGALSNGRIPVGSYVFLLGVLAALMRIPNGLVRFLLGCIPTGCSCLQVYSYCARVPSGVILLEAMPCLSGQNCDRA
jgi:hypothetical protein